MRLNGLLRTLLPCLAALGLCVPACTSAESSGGGDAGAGSGCSPEGTIEACYPGPASTHEIGECRDGSRTCQDGSWGACTGAVLPQSEVCGDLLDNDCNGVSDEGCPCQTGTTRACYTGPAATRGIGICTDGQQTCVAEAWSSECTGQVLPVAEVPCNGLDDDCDGVTEGAPGDPECCVPDCGGKLCGQGNGCGSPCQQGSGCCTPSCNGKLCGQGNGCGSPCQQGSGCCTPSCNGAACGDSDGCTGWCDGWCNWGYFCSGSLDCQCGPAPSFELSGGNCLPSCGALLGHLGLPNTGVGCCPTPCQDGTFGGGPGSTWDCNYCCASPQQGVSTCT